MGHSPPKDNPKVCSVVQVVREALVRRAEVRADLAYLRLITFLVPLLVALKKKMKIPNIAKLLPAFSGIYYITYLKTRIVLFKLCLTRKDPVESK